MIRAEGRSSAELCGISGIMQVKSTIVKLVKSMLMLVSMYNACSPNASGDISKLPASTSDRHAVSYLEYVCSPQRTILLRNVDCLVKQRQGNHQGLAPNFYILSYSLLHTCCLVWINLRHVRKLQIYESMIGLG